MYLPQSQGVNVKKTLLKSALWLTAEIWLTLLGIDDFADYCEFLIEQERFFDHLDFRSIRSATIHPQFCHKISTNCPVSSLTILSQTPEQYQTIYQSEVFQKQCLKIRQSCIKAEVISQFNLSPHPLEVCHVTS